jgi:hypothetical protein
MSKMKPFKELTRDEQIDLLDAWRDGELERINCNEWVKGYSLYPYEIYRRKPKPLTKPSIDVSHVANNFKWLARNSVGTLNLYEVEPFIKGYFWTTYGTNFIASTKAFASLNPGTCDWKDSLVDLDAIRKERGML